MFRNMRMIGLMGVLSCAMASADDDLIGGGGGEAEPAAKAAPKTKKAAAKPAKAVAAAKPAKPAKAAAKPAAKPKKAAGGARGTRGEGKFYFPIGSPEREKLKKTIVAKLKGPASTKDIAAKLGVETWKVRLVVKEAGAEKLLKFKKDGGTLMVSPK